MGVTVEFTIHSPVRLIITSVSALLLEAAESLSAESVTLLLEDSVPSPADGFLWGKALDNF
jgi:hypothetical protein